MKVLRTRLYRGKHASAGLKGINILLAPHVVTRVVRRNFAVQCAEKIPSLRSLLHEPIFMVQAAEYGSLHNPVPNRKTVSVLVAGKLLRHRLRQTGV